MFGDTLGMFSDGFGMVLRKSFEEATKKINHNFQKHVWEYFSCVGLPKTIMFSLFPDRKYKQNNNNNTYFCIFFYRGVGGMGAALYYISAYAYQWIL